jgi:hypothetical protein
VIAIGRLAVSVSKKLADAKNEKNPETGSDDESDKTENESDKEKKETDELADISKSESSIQKPFDSASNEQALKLISGAIFKTHVDLSHPLLYGITNSELAVFRNHAEFLTPSKNVYCNPIIYDEGQPLMAGYCSKANQEKFKGSASVVVHPVGRGRFILMADNPNFRGFWKATNRVFLNAVFFGDFVNPPRSR